MTFCPGESTCTPVATTCMPGVRPEATTASLPSAVAICTTCELTVLVAGSYTHTAVAFRVAETRRTDAPMVVLSTASPFKFPRDVLTALGVEAPASDFAAMAALTAGTGTEAPASLRELDKLEVRFKTVLQPADIRTAALR